MSCLNSPKAAAGYYPCGRQPHTGGAMHYVELDSATGQVVQRDDRLEWTQCKQYDRLLRYFLTAGRTTGPEPTGLRGCTNVLTGGYGYDDFTNPSDTRMSERLLGQGEDMEGDYNSSGLIRPRSCGGTEHPGFRTLSNLWPISIGGSVTGSEVQRPLAFVSSVALDGIACIASNRFFRRALKCRRDSPTPVNAWDTCRPLYRGPVTLHLSRWPQVEESRNQDVSVLRRTGRINPTEL